MNGWQLGVYGIASLAMSILSGIAGAGAGFVMTPLAIMLGLTPAQAVSVSKFNGIAVAVGSLGSLRAKKSISKRRIAAVMVLAVLVGLAVPYIIKSLDGQVYRIALGIMLLCMIPIMVKKKLGVRPHKPTRLQQGLGGLLLTLSLFLVGVFSGGLGSLVNVVLMGLLDFTANEAHIVKRWSSLALSIVVIFGVAGAGLLVWPVIIVMMSTSLVGSYIGGHIATRKGDAFAVNVLIGLMIISALVLIIGAF